jgi:hypothetical protein
VGEHGYGCRTTIKYSQWTRDVFLGRGLLSNAISRLRARAVLAALRAWLLRWSRAGGQGGSLGQLQVPGACAEHDRVDIDTQQSCRGDVSTEALHQEWPTCGDRRCEKVDIEHGGSRCSLDMGRWTLSQTVSRKEGKETVWRTNDVVCPKRPERACRVISSASGMERGEVFYGLTDWLGSPDPMTHYHYAPDSSSGLDD